MTFLQKFNLVDDIRIESKEKRFKGFFQIDEMSFTHRLFAGGWSKSIQREIFERGDAVAVLLYDPVEDAVVMIEQIRVGAMVALANAEQQATNALVANKNPWLLECIAGMVDKDETPVNVAIRESKEEAGVDISDPTFMLSYLSSPGGISERIYLYAARVDSEKAKGIHGLDEEGEDIKVHVLSRLKVEELLVKGVIDNAATVIAVQWLMLNRDRLLSQWGINDREGV